MTPSIIVIILKEGCRKSHKNTHKYNLRIKVSDCLRKTVTNTGRELIRQWWCVGGDLEREGR